MTQIRRTASHHGFSLIELLVVLSIIALLLGVLLPALMRARSTSLTANCGSNLKQIGVGLEMYVSDNRGWYPRALPLVEPDLRDDPAQWQEEWPPEICPLHWAMGYPSQILTYMGYEIVNPFDYRGFSDTGSKNYIPRPEEDSHPSNLFDSPANDIPLSERKCGIKIDYGLANRASQNEAARVKSGTTYLAADQIWALGFVEGSGGPNYDPNYPNEDWNGWWVPFLHANSTAHILMTDQSINLMGKDEFAERYTEDPPVDDNL